MQNLSQVWVLVEKWKHPVKQEKKKNILTQTQKNGFERKVDE